MKYILVLFLLILFLRASTQTTIPDLLHNTWSSRWIEVPGESPTNYGVYYFRKTIALTEQPSSFIIHVSADNRYKLFVNEVQVSLGPARGDIQHWNYESLDIAKFLKKGENVVAAQVWNEGPGRAEGQISLRTGFVLQCNDPKGKELNTDSTWLCIKDNSFSPYNFKIPTYYVAGPGEIIQMSSRIKNWNKQNCDLTGWKKARAFMEPIPKTLIGGYGTIPGWLLTPSILSPMELKPQRLASVRNSTYKNIPTEFPNSKSSFTIPPNESVNIILDQGFLTNAYPQFIFSGGKNASVSISYAEALFSKYPSKGNRNETEGKIFIGRTDSILSSGEKNQFFTTLSYRTYRFIRLKITTTTDSLTIEDFYGMATGYPFQLNAHLETENEEIQKMFGIGWRTARLCAMETYMDCPYYEQLQYIGDARIQALISIYNSGDERLLQNAMNEMDNSRQPEGITLSRHPSVTPQFIPPFSLWYIGMLHDYMMYGKDSLFLKNKLAGERQILQYFKRYQSQDGSLKNLPYWLFSDWVEAKDWEAGRAPVGKDGGSSVIDLQWMWACQLASDMENQFGSKSLALQYADDAEQLGKIIRIKYWNAERQLFADRAEKDLYSQHANILAILTGMTTLAETQVIAKKLLSDTSLAPASIYFKYYLHQALVKAGMGNDYLSWLGQWRENINMGLTTWAEISDVDQARSDCHAWGASPNIEFFRTVLGIDSDAPGFMRVKIEPHLGSIKNIAGEMPHPKGKISVKYKLENKIWNIEISLPDDIRGRFIWHGKPYPLKGGMNFLKMNDN